MNEEEYFYYLWNEMPDTVVTEEYFTKNQDLFQELTNEFYNYNERSEGSLPPHLARFVLEKVVENMLIFGIR
jgi:hypothetical protein